MALQETKGRDQIIQGHKLIMKLSGSGFYVETDEKKVTG